MLLSLKLWLQFSVYDIDLVKVWRRFMSRGLSSIFFINLIECPPSYLREEPRLPRREMVIIADLQKVANSFSRMERRQVI